MSVESDLRLDSENGLTQPDPGNGKKIVPTKLSTLMHLVTTGAETRTLPDPVIAGVDLTLCMKTDGGNCVVTASTAINAAGNTIMTFADESDVILLKAVRKGSALVWRVLGNDGVALS